LLDNDASKETLMELGLTLSQARVYIATAKLGKVKAKDLCEGSGVGRQEIYRILDELLKMGLIEKEISAPTHFRAVPISKGALLLFNRKQEEILDLKIKMMNLASEDLKIWEKQPSESEFLILPRKYLMETRGESSYRNAKKTIEFFAPFKRLVSCFTYNYRAYSEPIKRGVEMRAITEKVDTYQYQQIKKEAVNIFSGKNFSLRFVAQLDNVAFSLIDGKELYFPLNPDKSLYEDQSLWTNNKSLITMTHKYFSMNWKKALKPEQT
jgi:sugar-specific transcriptional regulator TrmB